MRTSTLMVISMSASSLRVSIRASSSLTSGFEKFTSFLIPFVCESFFPFFPSFFFFGSLGFFTFGFFLEGLTVAERTAFLVWEREKCFIYGYMASDIWLRTSLIVRKDTRCRHIGYSYRLTARVLLYAPSHRQDNTYHSLCYTSSGALAGTRNSTMGPPHEGSIWRPTAPWANALPLSYVPLPFLVWSKRLERGWMDGWMNGCLTTPQHKVYIGYWVWIENTTQNVCILQSRCWKVITKIKYLNPADKWLWWHCG